MADYFVVGGWLWVRLRVLWGSLVGVVAVGVEIVAVAVEQLVEVALVGF